MTPTRRILAASLASLALHLSPLVPGGCGLDIKLEMPEIEFEVTQFETVELDQELKGAPPPEPQSEPEVTPPPMGPDKPPEGEGPKPEAEPPKPKPKFGEKTSRVAELGPGSSNFFMLLAAKKVSGLPFAEAIVEIMSPLPDFDFIVTGGGFHALKDFNYIVIASPNLRDLTQTFLAVEYRLSQAEVQAGLERAAAAEGLKIDWEVRDGRTMGNPRPVANPDQDDDPRWFVFLDEDVAVYVREEFLPAITEGPDESKGNTAGNFVANLTKLKSFAAREPRAGLQLVLKDLRASIKLKGEPPFPIPNNLELMAEAAATPELIIKAEYLDAVEAAQMERQWTEDLPAFMDAKVPFYARFMVRSFYDATEVARDDKALNLRADFTKDQAKFILEQIAEGARRMLRRTPEQIEAARKQREEMWAARKNGKLSPSEALTPKDPGKSGKPPGEPLPAPGAPPPQDGGPAPSAPPDAPAPAPTPAPAPAPSP
ncbi:hypothetical protein [Nannocystis bainbridge]|uniref:Uncharacterized protein n=1 Tax=Nannocystis bainbridge TaxID=2995303 RepID=A0ABT5E590_9BACT|nr:hypothetical protein [Nannocystis bainbridge]MDC0720598.1 hypothetical protein [Nannocystis bainbridge]